MSTPIMEKVTQAADPLTHPRTPPRNASLQAQIIEDAKSTPVQPKLSVLTAYAVKIVDPLKLHQKLAAETKGHYIGPIPPNVFFAEFMPWRDDVSEAYKSHKPSKRSIAQLHAMNGLPESNWGTKYVDAFKNWPPKRYRDDIKCKLIFVDSHSFRDNAAGGLGVDVSAYEKRSNERLVARQTPINMDFANVETFVEFKTSHVSDPFRDGKDAYDPERVEEIEAGEEVEDSEEVELSEQIQEGEEVTYDAELDFPNTTNDCAEKVTDSVPDPQSQDESIHPNNVKTLSQYPFENPTISGTETRGQLACYAGATMALQFRNHLFCVVHFGKYARLIRWDRAFASVSQRFNWVEHPGILFEFYKRFAQLDRAGRGINPNFRPATVKEAEAARTAFIKHPPEYWTGKPQDAYEQYFDIKTQSFMLMKFNDKEYVVPAPHCDIQQYSPFGRSSRIVLVLPFPVTHKSKVLLLKEYWRDELAIPEAEIYKRLAKAKIKYVGKMEDGGDTGYLTLKKKFGDKWYSKGSGENCLRQLVNHIILLTTIGRDITIFRSAKDVVQCIGNAMEAHQEVYEKLSILHRDISVGNIMMLGILGDEKDPETRKYKIVRWQGLLLDWDHAVVLPMGTWQFLSAFLTGKPEAEHTVLDDRESAVHVLHWLALRYMDHDISTSQVRFTLALYDDDLDYNEQGLKIGSQGKIDMFRQGKRYTNPWNSPNAERVRQLLNTLFQSFFSRYTFLPEATFQPKVDFESRSNLEPGPDLESNQNFEELDLDKALYEKSIAALAQPSLIYKTMYRYARSMQTPQQKQSDRIDQNEVLTEYQVEPAPKRKGSRDLNDRPLKRSSVFLGLYPSSQSSPHISAVLADES